MSDVTLTAAVRQNLLSLQSTTDLIGRTQNRLSTGLRVAGPIDDPVAFFQAKALTDRASDFSDKKTGIDQGISTLTAATDAIIGVESLVRQLKGLATNAKSATTTTEIDNIVTQFNDIRAQVDLLTADATYQGLNLVNGTGSTLTVQFSNETASRLNVNSVDIRAGGSAGLTVSQFSKATQDANFNLAFISGGTLTGAGSGGYSQANSISFTMGGQTANTVSIGDTFSIMYGTQSITLEVGSTHTALSDGGAIISAGTYAVGTSISLYVVTDDVTTAGQTTFAAICLTATSATLTETDAITAVGVGFTTELNTRITNLDSALTTLRSRSQVLGANVAVLNSRLEFTKDYVNTLTAGSGKLTLADLNEEGANLLALQTRQQLGIQSLAFAGQSEQSILGLFR